MDSNGLRALIRIEGFSPMSTTTGTSSAQGRHQSPNRAPSFTETEYFTALIRPRGRSSRSRFRTMRARYGRHGSTSIRSTTPSRGGWQVWTEQGKANGELRNPVREESNFHGSSAALCTHPIQIGRVSVSPALRTPRRIPVISTCRVGYIVSHRGKSTRDHWRAYFLPQTL
jgi:hypothetical protein